MHPLMHARTHATHRLQRSWSLTIQCVLRLQNVFSYYTMCSLTTDCKGVGFEQHGDQGAGDIHSDIFIYILFVCTCYMYLHNRWYLLLYIHIFLMFVHVICIYISLTAWWSRRRWCIRSYIYIWYMRTYTYIYYMCMCMCIYYMCMCSNLVWSRRRCVALYVCLMCMPYMYALYVCVCVYIICKCKATWWSRRRCVALYVCQMCMPYMYALYVCVCVYIICKCKVISCDQGAGALPYMYALCVCLVCIPCVYALYVCLTCWR
jgi:hypothetical protein